MLIYLRCLFVFTYNYDNIRIYDSPLRCIPIDQNMCFDMIGQFLMPYHFNILFKENFESVTFLYSNGTPFKDFNNLQVRNLINITET